MWIVTGVGPLSLVKAAADALDADDLSPASAVSWFEEDAGRFRIEAYVQDEEDAGLVQAEAEAAAPGLALHVEAVRDADWVAMALDGLPAVRAGRFVVAGAHALSALRGGKKRIWIEASEAFGTGHHGTTRGCLLMLERIARLDRPPRRVLDVGAGSGVLALAAARLGAKADAIEIDARAAEIMGENVRNNRLAPAVRWRAGDGAKFAAGRAGGYDLVFANILMRPLIGMAGPLTAALAPGGRIVLSGLLRAQEPLVRQAYANRGLIVEHRIRREGWATLLLRRPGRRA